MFACSLKQTLCCIVITLAAISPKSFAAVQKEQINARNLIAAKRVVASDPSLAYRIAKYVQENESLQADKDYGKVISSLSIQAEALLRLGQNRHSLMVVDNALKISHKHHIAGSALADIVYTKAGLYSANSVSDALRLYQNAYKLYGSVGNIRGQCVTLISMSMLYTSAKDYLSALKYINQSLEVYDRDVGIRMFALINSGVVLNELHRYAEAEVRLRRALTIARTRDDRLQESFALVNLAMALVKQRKFAEADATIARGLLVTGTGPGKAVRTQMLAVAAEAAFARRRFEQAGSLVTRAFAGVDVGRTDMTLYQAHQVAFSTFNALHQPARALPHLIALKRLDDEATKVATTTNAALMSARFDFANQELRIARLRQEELRRNAEFERHIFYGVSGATLVIIVLLGVGMVLILRSREQVRAANDDLEVTNVALGKALAAKTEFLATTSHEIRTPLNGILGMTQVMLADAGVGGTVRDRLHLVHDAGSTMKSLVDDILDVAKMETGQIEIEDAPFDLCSTIDKATRLWAAQARGKGLAFTVDVPPCPVGVVGDAARVRQIVFNLLSNAVKFTAEGSIAVTLRETDSGWRVQVADTGIGIASDKQALIFEPFRQADAGTTRQYGGTGLGLAICRRLADAMGGGIGVESRSGEGATFTLELPLAAAELDAKPIVAATAASDLLVFEPNPIARSMVSTLLAPRIAGLVLTGDADDALARIERSEVRRILVDLSGRHAAAAQAVLARANAAGIAVIVLHAPDAEPSSLEAGDGVLRLAKPVTPQKLLSALDLTNGPLATRAA